MDTWRGKVWKGEDKLGRQVWFAGYTWNGREPKFISHHHSRSAAFEVADYEVRHGAFSRGPVIEA